MFFRLLEVWLMFVESLADVCVEVFVIVRFVFWMIDILDEKGLDFVFICFLSIIDCHFVPHFFKVDFCFDF